MRQSRRSGPLLLIVVVATLVYPAVPAAAAEDAVIVAAGDIGDCATTGDEATAVLLDGIPGTVAALGDIAYPGGTARQFPRLLRAELGPPRARTRPAAGNHEYKTTSAATPAISTTSAAPPGARGKGWYSYDLGAWHVVVAQFELRVSSADAARRRPRSTWLTADLAANAGRSTPGVLPPAALQLRRARQRGRGCRPLGGPRTPRAPTLVLNGHDHSYERFAPQDPWGRADAAFGIREFVVGTGGTALRPKSPERAEQRGLLRDSRGARADAPGGRL